MNYFLIVSDVIVVGQFLMVSLHSDRDIIRSSDLHLTDQIRNDLNYHRNSVLVSLDSNKASSSLNFGTMIKKLNEEFQFSSTACKLVMSYLCSRSQFVFLNERTSNFVPLVQITYELKVVSDTSERLLLRLKCVVNDVTRFVYGIRRR